MASFRTKFSIITLSAVFAFSITRTWAVPSGNLECFIERLEHEGGIEAKQDDLGTRSKRILKMHRGLKNCNVSNVMAEAAKQDIVEKARILDDAFQADPGNRELRTFDTIVIGGGPQTATLVSNLPRGRTLVMNASDDFGTFDKMGETFFINSLEHADQASPNIMVGGKVQARDATAEVTPPGKVLGNVTVLNLALSRAEFSIGHSAAKIVHAEAGTPTRYVLITQDGQKLYTDHVAIMTGLGKEKFPLKDPESLKVIEEARKSKNPAIEFIDAAMAGAQEIARAGKNPLKATGGKRVVIVGSGDGGAIQAEYLLGLGPSEGYGGHASKLSEKDLPSIIRWFSQKAADSSAYKQTTWERYWDLAPHFDSGKIVPNPNHVLKIEKIRSGPNKGAFRVFYGPGPKDYEVADRVIFCAGYDQSGTSKLLSGLTKTGDPAQLRFVDGKVAGHDKPVHIGMGVNVDGAEQPGIYVGGPATGGLETVGEAGGDKSPRIQALAPRTAELGDHIDSQIEKPRSAPAGLYRETLELIEPEKNAVPNQLQMNVKPKSFRIKSESEREDRIAFRLLKAAESIELPAGKTLEITIRSNVSEHTVTLLSNKASTATLKEIQTALEQQPELLELLLSRAPKGSGSEIRVKFLGNREESANDAEIEFESRK